MHAAKLYIVHCKILFSCIIVIIMLRSIYKYQYISARCDICFIYIFKATLFVFLVIFEDDKMALSLRRTKSLQNQKQLRSIMYQLRHFRTSER